MMSGDDESGGRDGSECREKDDVVEWCDGVCACVLPCGACDGDADAEEDEDAAAAEDEGAPCCCCCCCRAHVDTDERSWEVVNSSEEAEEDEAEGLEMDEEEEAAAEAEGGAWDGDKGFGGEPGGVGLYWWWLVLLPLPDARLFLRDDDMQGGPKWVMGRGSLFVECISWVYLGLVEVSQCRLLFSSQKPNIEMAGVRKPRWVALESNPEVMNEFIYNLGVSRKWSFTDCYSISPDQLAFVPSPCVALLLVYPWRKIDERTRPLPETSREEAEGSVYFMHQMVSNACGSIAVVHALANNRDKIEIGRGALSDFFEHTAAMNPHDRGESLGLCEGIAAAHDIVAKKGQTDYTKHEKVNYHFICFVHANGKLYELDGARPSPIVHCATTAERFIYDAAAIIQNTFLNRTPAQIDFGVITLGAADSENVSALSTFTPPPTTPSATVTVTEENITLLMEMGFPRTNVENALQLAGNNPELALSYLM
ncbi:ubiquitin carboxyl-terminal esterase L3 [Pelomyxa schiedti]|nr:ubiquitin carboxyl-terminal esterase L3 [Pelomyxa schiedti]